MFQFYAKLKEPRHSSYGLLGYDVWSRGRIPTIRRTLLLPSSGFMHNKWIHVSRIHLYNSKLLDTQKDYFYSCIYGCRAQGFNNFRKEYNIQANGEKALKRICGPNRDEAIRENCYKMENFRTFTAYLILLR